MQSTAATDQPHTASDPIQISISSNSSYKYGSTLSDFAANPDYPHLGDNVGGSGTEVELGGAGVDPASDRLGDLIGGISESSGKVNRIARYEAMAGLPFYGGGSDAGFIVTKTNWAGKSPRNSPVARFPNEVLIHILSFLGPSTLLATSLISKRFHALVNSPQAWRSAFIRFFPPSYAQLDNHGSPLASQDRRYFSRLATTQANENAWRKEYIQRTRLLRNLAKGRIPNTTSKQAHGRLVITYPSRTGQSSISHMDASFSINGVRAVHASVEAQLVTASNPVTGEIERRPVLPEMDRILGAQAVITPDMSHVRNDHPDYDVAIEMNVNRVMDISEELGWIVGENVPDGRCYVHPYPSPYFIETRGTSYIQPDGYGFKPLVTSVWIANKRSGGVRDSTDAAVIVGNSRGFIRIFSIAFGKSYNHLDQIKSFCISPGVPIVQIKVDEDFLPRRLKQKKPWISVVNALGEIYYLRSRPNDARIEDWEMVQQTSRIPTPFYNEIFPKPLDDTSPEGLTDKDAQRIALLKMDYSKIKELWVDCRMDWFIEVDWAGENIVTGRTGSESYWYGNLVEMADKPLIRYHLRKTKSGISKIVINGNTELSTKQTFFGDDGVEDLTRSSNVTPLAKLSEVNRSLGLGDEWLATELRIHDTPFTRITAHALDNSHLARLTAAEDPTLREGLPGDNGRLFAIGTNTGIIFVFNARPTSLSGTAEFPVRTIHTNSPQISTLAISSLVVVHGGDDGLVQAWDPLGSTSSPIRTLHSRFSARARRRIEQNDGAVAVDNQFAARCLILDPDPMNLRGVVALGTHLRYWSFSAVDIGGGKKRRKFTSGRSSAKPSRNKGEIRQAIQSDELAMRKDRDKLQKEAEELEKRYGIVFGRSALNEEEMIAYAQMISQEAFEVESSRSDFGSSFSGTSFSTITPEGSIGEMIGINGVAANLEDADLERALRLSLQDVELSEDQGEGIRRNVSDLLTTESGPSNYNTWSVPTLSSSTKSRNGSPSARKLPKKKGWEKISYDSPGQWRNVGSPLDGSWDEGEQVFEDDLELAIRLSLQEHETSDKGKYLA